MRQIPFLILSLLLLISSYFLGMRHAMIPTIGDELVYMTIAENTAESNQWLPLLGETGVYNTKPPLLFWQGMISTSWMQNKSFFTFRWPSLVLTVGVTLLLTLFGYLFFNKLSVGLSAGVIYLCFFSTFKYGRHFLMHPHESLFSILPLLAYIYKRKLSWRFASFCGLCFGIVALSKSFMFAVTGGAALGVLIWVDGHFVFNKKLFLSVPKVVWSVVIGLLIFGLWLLLDPDPAAVYKEFVLGENAGKFSGGFWQGLVNYPPWNVWLGPFWNGGFLAPVLLATLISFFKKKTNRHEKLLLTIVLFYLVLFSIPSQRQSNYVIPAMLPLALLVANRFSLVAVGWIRFSLMLMAFLALPLSILISYAQYSYAGSLFSWPLFASIALLLASTFWFLIKPKGFGVVALAVPICAVYLSVDFFVESFSNPWTQKEVMSWGSSEVYVPSNFRYKQKRYSMLMPEINIQAYNGHRDLPDEGLEKIEEGALVAIIHSDKDWPKKEGLKVYSQKPFLFERHSSEELKKIILKGELSLLFGYLSIVRKPS